LSNPRSLNTTKFLPSPNIQPKKTRNLDPIINISKKLHLTDTLKNIKSKFKGKKKNISTKSFTPYKTARSTETAMSRMSFNYPQTSDYIEPDTKQETIGEQFVGFMNKMTNILKAASTTSKDIESRIKNERDLITHINNAVITFEMESMGKDAFELYSKIKLNQEYFEEFETNNDNIKKNKTMITNTSERRIFIYKKFFEVCNNTLNEISHSLKKEDSPKSQSQPIQMNVNVNLNTINNITNPEIKNEKQLKKLLTKSRFKDDSLDFNTEEGEISINYIPNSRIKEVNKPIEMNMNYKNLSSRKSMRSNTICILTQYYSADRSDLR
jgi:hypothetical protein